MPSSGKKASFVIGVACVGLSLAYANSHRELVRDTHSCQFDLDCAAWVEGTGAPALCINNVAGQDPYCAFALAPPPNAEVSTALALGRRAAAADFAWMRIIQFIGAPHSEAVRYEGIDGWVRLVTELDPRFRQPYFHGAVLLSTSPNRAGIAEEILLSGQRAFPDDLRAWEWDMWLGFVQYFGLLQPQKAADSYQRSFDAGGPPYLEHFARDLRVARDGCSDLWIRLNEARAGAADSSEGALLSSQFSREVLINCWEVYLSAAVAKFRMAKQLDASSLDELRPMGLLPEEPPVIPGMCWMIEGLKVRLRSCADGPNQTE